MKLYLIEVAPSSQMDLNGYHELELPILWCPIHKRRMSYRVNYPCFDVDLFPAHLREVLRRYAGNYSSPVDPDNLRRLMDSVAEYCPKRMFLGGLVGFGPFHVQQEYGKRGDFNQFDPFSLGATASAIERMEAHRVKLPPSQELITKPEHIQSRGFREFEIHRNVKAAASLALDSLERCPACGKYLAEERLAVPLEDVAIAKKSIPKGENLFRWVEYDSVLLASDRFVDAFHDLGMRGLQFREVGTE